MLLSTTNFMLIRMIKKICFIIFFCVSTISTKAQVLDRVDINMLYCSSDVTVLEDAKLSLILYDSPIKLAFQIKQQSFKSGSIPTLNQVAYNNPKLELTRSQWLQNTGDNTIGYHWNGTNGFTYLLYYTRGATAVLVKRNGQEIGIFTCSQNMGNHIERIIKKATQKDILVVYQ